MKCIRGGSGLGDSLYVRPIADHFVRAGNQVTVKSDYPDVFAGAGVIVEAFTRQGTNVLAHYSSRKARSETNQWQDVCINAAVGEIPLSFEWGIKNSSLTAGLLSAANGRPIVMVNGGRPPMGRTDGYGNEMLPTQDAFDAVLSALSDCFTVKVGKGAESYPLKTDMDLSEQTTTADLLDIASVASGLVGQCSFMIPLAEAFDKPLLVVWAAAGLISRVDYIRLCTPQKILSKPSSGYVMDDMPTEQIKEAALAFCDVL